MRALPQGPEHPPPKVSGPFSGSLEARGLPLVGSVAISTVVRRVENRPTVGPGLKVLYCFAGAP